MQEIGSKTTTRANINLIDESFDISHSENYALYIQIGWGTLSLCVLDVELNKYIVLRNYPVSKFESLMIEECKTVFECDELFGLKYKDCRCLWVGQRSTIVPEKLFDKDIADRYLAFNHGKANYERTLYNCVKGINLYNVFSCSEDLFAELQKYQVDVKIFHHATSLIDYTTKMKHIYNVSVYFHSGNLDIIVAHRNKLRYFNTFQIGAPPDSVYYYSLVLNSLDVDIRSTKIAYSGSLQYMPAEVSILKDFVMGIVEYEVFTDVKFNQFIVEPFQKEFVNLFNLRQCE